MEESGDCGAGALACVSVSSYDAGAEPEPDTRFIFPVDINVLLDSAMVNGLGGAPVALQAYVMDAILLQIRDQIGGEWNRIPYEIEFENDGSVMVSTAVRRLGDVALTVNAELLERARLQMSAALGTPTATPIPTATPTATPEPTPVPIPAHLPDTGGSTAPFGMILALAAAAALITTMGLRALAGRKD